MASVVLNFPAGGPLAEAFAQLGYKIQTPREAVLSGELAEALLAVSDFRSMAKNVRTAVVVGRLIERAGVPHVYWNREGPSHFGERRWRLWVLEHGAAVDAYATHTLQNCNGFARDVLYLPNAADSAHCHLHGSTLNELRDSSRYSFDVSFFGNIDRERYPEIAPRAEFLTELAARLTKMGIMLHVRGDPLTLAEQISLIQSSRINLSVHAGADSRYARRQLPGPRGWGLPERCYGVPGTGGFLLSDWRFHAADDFVPGLEWASFVDIDDCVSSIQHFLLHFDQARAIAEAAHRRVVAQHTYADRARKLITFAKLWRSERLGLPPSAERRPTSRFS